LILTIACVAQFMVVLDMSIVTVALPRMSHDLHFTLTSAQWVVNAYVLTFAGFQLLGGRAADRTASLLGHVSNASALVSGYQRTFQISAGVTFVALMVTGLLPRQAGRATKT
jgi:MFS family permease